MTRMLWKLLIVILFTSMIGGCSLFSSEDEGAPSEVDTESVSGEVVLDAEDEMLEESADLVDGLGDDDFGGDGLADEGFADDEVSLETGGGTQSTLDEEFSDASLGGGDDFGEEEFAGEDFGEDEFAEEGMEISATDDGGVDQQLAEAELGDDEFSEFGDEEGQEDEFALEAEPMDEQPMDDLVVDVPDEGMAAAASGDFSTEITNLEYKAFDNGGTVVIETSTPAQFQKIVDPELNQVVIQVQDAFLPERFKRPYVTKDFKQDIATINAYADVTGAARFVIQLKRPIEPSVQQEGNAILVMTAGGAPMQQAGVDPLVDPGPDEQSLDQLVAENQMQIQTRSGGQNSVQEQAGALVTARGGAAPATGTPGDFSSSFGGVEKSGLSIGGGSFSGEKINLEFVDEEVRTIIEVISELSGVNLIMDKEVEGKTSIKLRDVPWDQALLVLLRSQGLGYVKQGSVLRIAKQSILSQEAQAVSAQIKNEKQAKLLSGGIKVKYIPVSYADVKDLASKLKDFTSKEGKVAFDNRTSSLVITDYGEYIDRIVDLVKALDTAPMQVEIESKLVEARETFIREAGINWDIGGQDFSFGDQTANISAGLASNNVSSNGFTMDLSVGTFDIFGDLSAALSVFESDDKIKVLSQPRIMTMNKVPAEIKQTLQVPITTTQITVGGPPTITFDMLDVVLGLKVTPQITFKGDVILEVDVQRDFAGARNQDGSRELNKRQAKSTVMVKNGKTAVIGGIYQLDDGNIETGIPWIKDIPLIGNLFRQTREEKIKSELLLFLKPKILREVDGPLVTKATNPSYDAFEELSLDEGKRSDTLDQPLEENDSMGFEGEDDFELEDGSNFEDELESLEL